jgi:hypothetical protein
MQFNPSISHELANLINSDNSRHTQELISKLPEDKKVQMAVQLIIEGRWVYFTCGHVHSQSPFRLDIRERVVKELKGKGYKIIEQEDRDDGTSVYGPEMKGFLDGVYVYLQSIKSDMAASGE